MTTFTSPAEWRKNRSRQKRLKNALAQPIIVEAIATVLGLTLPSVQSPSTIESLAIRHARNAGVHDAFRTLIGLTMKVDDAPKEEEPFAHLIGGEMLTPAEIAEETRRRDSEQQDTDPQT